MKKLFNWFLGKTSNTSEKKLTRDYTMGINRIHEYSDGSSLITHNETHGLVDGKYYVGYVDEVKQLKRERRHQEAVELLLKLVDATENESKSFKSGVAPWYYEQLAILYRKEKRYSDEVAILERYNKQTKAPGGKPGKLAERLSKAKALLEKSKHHAK